MITCSFEDGGTGNLRHVCVNVILLNDKGQVLLTRRSMKLSTGAGKYCLPGGYLSRDESLTEGASREALEETGYKVSNLTLFRIRDIAANDPADNDNRQNVTFCFSAQAEEKIGTHDAEVLEAHWFDFGSLPQSKEVAFDHLTVSKEYKKYQEKHDVNLPIMASQQYV